jgi:hypothetical protein
MRTYGKKLERLFKILLVVGFQSGSPILEFGLERHFSYGSKRGMEGRSL